MSKYLITGGNGMLAFAIKNNSFFKDHIAYDVDKFDLTNPDQMRVVLSELLPEYVINCAAYTDVTKAETEKNLAFKINAEGVKNLCVLAKEFKFKLVHFSTDFVFPGIQKIDKTEEDDTDPVNTYGASKLAGELEVINLLPKSLIIRISWLYGPNGRNFVSIISNLMRQKDELKIVADQFGKTTYTIDVADALAFLMENQIEGIVHFANGGASSRYEFTQEIKKILEEKETINCNILPIKASEYPDSTPRPEWSVLDTYKYEKIRRLSIRHWKEALRDFLNHPNG